MFFDATIVSGVFCAFHLQLGPQGKENLYKILNVVFYKFCLQVLISINKFELLLFSRTDNHQIFLGTPEIMANFHKRLLTSSTRGALIIEDVSGILEDAENRLHLLSIFERLKLPIKTCELPNNYFFFTLITTLFICFGEEKYF